MPYQIARFGWLPDPPDHRDYRADAKVVVRAVAQMAAKAETISAEPPSSLPAAVDLRGNDPRIEDQETLGSCTAQAVVGLAEHLQKALYGRYTDASRLFLYKVTRSLLGWTGDTGAFVRSTIKAMRIFGTCPEDYWLYDVGRFDDEPSPFCYAFALSYRALTYYRMDGLEDLKASLAQSQPFAFGFSVYESIWRPEVEETGEIPLPGPTDRQIGGHAVVAVGYDDSQGALLIRNSWGTGWGVEGYGWLPYEYVEWGLARDFWALAEMDYVDLEDALRTASFGAD
ncbi:MAG: C1 family peptidase [Armatimonadota bacterium]|jgi:C1A family cysteine protease